MSVKEHLFLFHTPLGVRRVKNALVARQITFQVINAPRKLTAECGMAVVFSLPRGENFQTFINEDVSAVYQLNGQEVALLWQDKT